MTHSAEHIVVTALKTPVGEFKLWHYVVAALIVCYVAGYLVGRF